MPRASRATTVILIVALVLVVVSAGVLGTIAVLMTRNPDLPLGGRPPAPLALPIHFAPVTAVQRAPCPGAQAVLDEAGQNCYLIEKGVDVTAVHRIEAVAEKDGTYAVRIAVGPTSRSRLADLTRDTMDQQIVIVVAQKVISAPKVTQAITEDSLTIDGSFTKEQADALVAKLKGEPAPAGQQPAAPGQPAPGQPAPGQPASGQPAPGQPAPGQPAPGQPAPDQPAPGQPAPGQSNSPSGAGTGTGTADGAGGGTGTGSTPGARTPRTVPTTRGAGRGRAPDKRFGSCKEAIAAGYGPYHKGVHPEYQFYRDVDGDGVVCEPSESR